MKKFLEKLLSPMNLMIPLVVRISFKQQFPGAYNPEWAKQHKVFEVIFYLDEQECIAGYDNSGNNLYLKKNLKIENIPTVIESALFPKWELMNLLKIIEMNKIHYECIVRDKEWIRYALYIDQNGKVLNEEKL
jgi:hypothetical protein